MPDDRGQAPAENWQAVRDLFGDVTLELGPYFAHQVLGTPRHVLFTLSRYKFAAKLLPAAHASVLELGCTEGIGTLLLAEDGHMVTGVDADGEAVNHAKKTIKSPNIRFEQADFLGKRFGSFKAVVSLDVVEHIPPEQEHEFFGTVTQNLEDDGFCVIGTPNACAAQYASEGSRIAHVNLFTAERLAAALSQRFANVFMFGMNDEVVHTGFYPMSHYLMALACGKRKA